MNSDAHYEARHARRRARKQKEKVLIRNILLGIFCLAILSISVVVAKDTIARPAGAILGGQAGPSQTGTPDEGDSPDDASPANNAQGEVGTGGPSSVIESENRGSADEANAPFPAKDLPYLSKTIMISDEGVPVVTNPDDLLVVVNKERNLPADYEPDDLVVPDVRFSFSGDDPKKYMRREAANALEKLFEAADQENLRLFAVSGYRSYQTQRDIFAYNVNRTGSEEQANQFSAKPGQSEHQTGLAMDVSSPAVNYRLDEPFADTPEGRWLAEHGAEFGFIIRYPKGKEDVTGYQYEPWHIRYVGIDAAKEIYEQGITLEEYLAD